MKRYQKGETVTILKDDDPFHETKCSIISCEKDNRYLVRVKTGRKRSYKAEHLVAQLSHVEEQKLYREQLIQLQLLAVDLGDESWFEEVGRKRELLEQDLMLLQAQQ